MVILILSMLIIEGFTNSSHNTLLTFFSFDNIGTKLKFLGRNIIIKY